MTSLLIILALGHTPTPGGFGYWDDAGNLHRVHRWRPTCESMEVCQPRPDTIVEMHDGRLFLVPVSHRRCDPWNCKPPEAYIPESEVRSREFDARAAGCIGLGLAECIIVVIWALCRGVTQ